MTTGGWPSTRRAPLEDWLRDLYFDAKIDISSSGVGAYSVGEVRRLAGIELAGLDRLRLRDSRTCGSDELRAEIARRWGNGDSTRVLAAHGSSEAHFLILSSLLRRGDEVIVVEPAYHTLCAIVEQLGCSRVPWPLRSSEGFVADLDLLERLVTARTRAIVVNFPHNPTGATVDAAGQARLVTLAERYGIYLIWDNAFADLMLDADPLPDVSNLYDRAISFGTLSKAFGLPGLRVGWAIAPADLIDACIPLRDHTTIALSPLVEHFAVAAIRNAETLMRPWRETALRNRALLDVWAAANHDEIDYARPRGGVVAFPRLRGVRDSEDFCRELMNRHGVLLVPGSCFGLPPHVRLGYGGDAIEFVDGLSAVTESLKARSGRGQT